jgi:hypothetical protein
MLPGLDTPGGFIHRKIAVFVGSNHVVGLQAWVETIRAPYPSDRRLCLENDDIGIWVNLKVCLCCCETRPPYIRTQLT